MKIRYRSRCCCRSSVCIPISTVCMSITIVSAILIFVHTSVTLSYESIQTFTVDETDLNDAKITLTSNLHILHEDYFNTTQLLCRYPTLKIDNPEIWAHLNPVRKQKPDCGGSIDWVYVDNG